MLLSAAFICSVKSSTSLVLILTQVSPTYLNQFIVFVNISDFVVLGVLFWHLSRHTMPRRCRTIWLDLLLWRTELRVFSAEQSGELPLGGCWNESCGSQKQAGNMRMGFLQEKTLPICRALRLIYLKCKPNISYRCSFTLKAFNWQNTSRPFILK